MYEVGKTYLVPTADLMLNGRSVTFVLLGNHVGEFSQEDHSHLDRQFIPDDVLAEIREIRGGDQMIAGPPTHQRVLREMVCLRPYVPIQHYPENVRWKFMAIQKTCQTKTMTGLVCPHQGCDLSQVPTSKVKGEEVVVCPCHGLRWSVETGKMAPRLPRKTPG